MDEKLAILQAKKIGLFIRQARETLFRSEKECADWLNIEIATYQAMENGTQSPSLPQLESLAYFLDTSFDRLLKGPAGSDHSEKTFSREVNDQLIALRDRIIAVNLKQARLQKGLALEKLADLTRIPLEQLSSFESGSVSLPIVDLEKMVDVLGLDLEVLFAPTGPLAHEVASPALQDQPGQAPVLLPGMSAELQEFLSKPVNRPYIELAMRLSQMEAAKLRSIATSLLEITY